MEHPFDLRALLESVKRFPGKKTLVIGDLMLDHYLFGQVSRISPEGPVPVVHVESERHLLGGAGNVARNMLALGARPFLASICGDDEPGTVLTALLDREGMQSLVVRDPDRTTTIKTRIMAQNQQVVRVDRETDKPVREEALQTLCEGLRPILPHFSCIVVSDYAKGVVCEGLMRFLREETARLTPRPLILVDPKPKNAALYAGVDLLTPNAKEAGELSGISMDGRNAILRAGHAIFRKIRCARLLVTLGPEGIALFEGPDKVSHIPTMAKKVFDVTGAGDSIIAALAVGLAAELPLLDACVLANHAAGVVVGKVGAATVAPEELLASLHDAPPLEARVWRDG